MVYMVVFVSYSVESQNTKQHKYEPYNLTIVKAVYELTPFSMQVLPG